jgi:hypothetical protein
VDEEITPEQENKMSAIMAEIRLAHPELAEFLVWVAHHEDYSEEEFMEHLGAVYSYSRAKNPSLENLKEESSEQGTD